MNPEQAIQPQPAPQQPIQPPAQPVESYGTQQPTMQQPAVPQQNVLAQPFTQPMQQGPVPPLSTFQPLQPQYPASTSMHQIKKPLILFAVALVVVLGGITAAMTLLKSDKEPATPAAVKQETHTTTDTPTTPAATTPTTPTTPSADQAAQDTQRRTSINTMHSRLEEYYNNNNAYPSSFTTATFETPLSITFFTAPNGKPIVMKTPVKDQATAVAVPLPTKDEQYQYIPYGCSGNDCTKYIIRAYQAVADAQGSNVFTKFSLN